MASLGHVAVGLLAGRLYRSDKTSGAALPMLAFSALAVLPDLDYVGVMLGLPNAGPCGHRGASHSLAAPLLAMMLVAAVAPRLRLPRWRAAVAVGLVVASHLILDILTESGRGLPLLWPFSFYRFELPWRAIPDAPCGLEYFSMAGLRAAAIELVIFLPALLGAVGPRFVRQAFGRLISVVSRRLPTRLRGLFSRRNVPVLPRVPRPS